MQLPASVRSTRELPRPNAAAALRANFNVCLRQVPVKTKYNSARSRLGIGFQIPQIPSLKSLLAHFQGEVALSYPFLVALFDLRMIRRLARN